MVMQGIHLAERGAHLACFGHKAFRQRRKGDKAFLQVHAFFAKRDEEVGPRIGIDNGLQANFGLVHLKGWRRLIGVVAGGTNEVADHADVRIQRLGCCSTCPTQADSLCTLSCACGPLLGGDLGLRSWSVRSSGWSVRSSGWRGGRRLCGLLLRLDLAKLAL